jgi:hypothetical protein
MQSKRYLFKLVQIWTRFKIQSINWKATERFIFQQNYRSRFAS